MGNTGGMLITLAVALLAILFIKGDAIIGLAQTTQAAFIVPPLQFLNTATRKTVTLPIGILALGVVFLVFIKEG